LITGKGTLDTLRADSVCCDFSVTGRTLHVDTLFLRSRAGSLSGRGDLALLDSTETSDFQLFSDLTSLDFLKYLLPLERTSLKNARISCAVTGRSPETRVEARADARSAALDDLYLETLQVSGEGTITRELSLENLAARADAAGVSYGEATARAASFAARSAGNHHALNASMLMDDGRIARVAGSILTLPDSTVVDIDTLDFAAEGGAWSLEAPARITLGRRFAIDRLMLRNGPRAISARGYLDPSGTQDLSFSMDSISLAQLGQFVGRKDMGGFLSLSVKVSGPADAATAVGTVRAELSGGSSGTVSVMGDIDWRDSALTARAFVNRQGGSPLASRAVFSKPLSIAALLGDGPRDSTSIVAALDSLILRADRFDLATIHPFLNQKSIRRLEGFVSADIVGTRTGPSLPLSGPVAIDSGLVELPALGVTYREIALQASLGGDAIHVDRFHVASGEGTVDGDGVLHLGDPGSNPGSLHLILEKFLAVQSLNVKATLSGDIRLTGPRDAPTVTGSLRLDDSYYYAETGPGESSAEQVELTDADYATLRERFGYVKINRRTEGAAALPEVTAKLEVTLERNTWIRRRANPTLAVELDGKLDIAMSPRSPLRIVGTLRPVAGRSYVSQFGRQFEVTSGEIILNGNLEEIELGVDSEYRVKSTSGSGLTEVTLMMRVEGRMGRYAFRLTSDPPMSEPEILQYLATGRASTGALARTNDNYNMGSAAALEQVVGVAGSLTEGKLPFDVFQIRQDGARGVIIVAGNYVSPKTYLGVRQPIVLDASSQNTYYKEQTQFEFEYETLPWLFLNFQGGSSRLLLLLKGRYAY
jgi:autotransporter translocation and assembly factor TamB